MTLQERRDTILRGAPGLMDVMMIVRGFGLPDWMVFSGAVYQPVSNAITDRPLEHGLNDYDLGYFDGVDLSWAAEDSVIQRVAAAMPPRLRNQVEVRNQARVHLWFESRFGEPYSPLKSSTEALSRFTAPAFAVGARLEPDDTLSIFAPFGLDDLFELRLRPTTQPPALGFATTVAKAKARWPEIVVDV